MINRQNTGLCVLLVIVGCGGQGDDLPMQQQIPSMSAADLGEKVLGTWQVTYEDEALGYVTGTAFLDPAVGTAALTLRANGHDAPVRLMSNSVTIKDSEIIITLPPGSPQAVAEFQPVGAIQQVGQNVRLSLGDGTLEVNLSEPGPVSGDVTISLFYDAANDTLAGQWVQAVDAESGSAVHGGRQGFFRYGDATTGGGEMVGREIWQRPPPVIKGTFAIGDQFSTSSTGPSWPYPYVVGSSAPAPRGVDERFLMLVGENLPKNTREVIEFESADSHLRYRIYRTMDSYDSLPAADAAWRDQGFAYIEQLKATGQAAFDRLPEDDFLIVQVRLEPGILPGRKTFRLNGVETEWILRFGDHRADIGFARDVTRGLRALASTSEPPPIQTHLSDFVYQSEQVFFEVRAHNELPMDELRFFVSKNGKPVLFDGDRELLATPVDGKPKVYRSEPIYLVTPGSRPNYPKGAKTIEVTRQDRLQATLAENVLAANPASVDVAIMESPVELRRVILQQPAPDGLRWTDAVMHSSECALDNLVTDAALEAVTNAILAAQSLDPSELVNDALLRSQQITQLIRKITSGNDAELSREESELFVDYAPVNWVFEAIGDPHIKGRLETSIKIGEHAGMLIIRQVLVDLLRQNLPLYAGAMDDQEILGMRERLRPYISYDPNLLSVDLGDIGINNVRIAAPDGHPWKLEMSYLTSVLESEYGLSGEALVRYQIEAMREARKAFSESIRTTIAQAEALDDCDVYELSKLTGFGMEQVVGRAKAALMMKIPGEGGLTEWAADWSAQVHLDQVAHISETLAFQEGVSKEGWDDLFTAITIASIPMGQVVAGTRAAYAFWAISSAATGTDMAVSIYNKTYLQWREQRELEYALGASAIIGTSRYNAARSNDTSAWTLVLSAAELVYKGGLVHDAWIGAGELATRSAVERGSKIVEGYLAEGSGQFALGFADRALSLTQHYDLAAAVHHAMGLENTIGRAAMVEREVQVLQFVDALVKMQQQEQTPEWAAGLDQDAQAILGDMVFRKDIRALLEQDVGEVAKIARDATGFRLLHRPQTTFEDLQQNIERLKNRPPSRGPRFLEQTAELEYQEVESDMNDEGFFFDRKGDSEHVVLDVYEGRDSQHNIFHIERSRIDDSVFGGGKDMLRFDLTVQHKDLHFASTPRVERNVEAMKIRYADDAPGVPMNLVADLRSFQVLGFDYGDPQLGGIILSNVRDARLLGEMHWMRLQEPALELDDLFRLTTAMDEIDALATQIGFKAGAISIVDSDGNSTDPWQAAWSRRAPLQHLVNRPWFRNDDSTDWGVLRDAFLRSHNVPSNRPDRKDSVVPYGYDIAIELVPLF